MPVTKNDLDALKAAFAGLRSTASRLLAMQAAVDDLERTVEASAPEAAVDPPSDLMRAAAAHAIAAGAFSGLLHRLFTPTGVAPASAMELTDSAGENA